MTEGGHGPSSSAAAGSAAPPSRRSTTTRTSSWSASSPRRPTGRSARADDLDPDPRRGAGARYREYPDSGAASHARGDRRRAGTAARPHRARRLWPARAAGVAGRPTWRAQSAPVVAAAPPRRDADPGRHPGGRRRDRRHVDAHGRRASIRVRSSCRSASRCGATRWRRTWRRRSRRWQRRSSTRRSGRGYVASSRPPTVRGGSDADPKPLRREDGRLDVSRSAAELERQVRAYQPWPGSFVDTDVGRLIVWTAEPAARRSASWNLRYRRDRSGRWRSATAARRPAGGRQADVVGGVRPRSTGDRRQ